jgi:hypothetical protein
LGKSILVVLCVGSTFLLAPKLRTRHFPGAVNKFLVSLPKSASNNLRNWFLSPTGRLNFGFITEGKLTVVFITPYSWGSQLVYAPTSFLAPLPGRKRISARGVSHFQSFYFVTVFLVSLLYFRLHLFIKNTKKLVPFIVVIFVYLF